MSGWRRPSAKTEVQPNRTTFGFLGVTRLMAWVVQWALAYVLRAPDGTVVDNTALSAGPVVGAQQVVVPPPVVVLPPADAFCQC